MAWLTGLSEQGRKGGEVIERACRGEGRLVGSLPLLFNPAWPLVGGGWGRLCDWVQYLHGVFIAPTGPSHQRKEREGKAPGILNPTLPVCSSTLWLRYHNPSPT